MSLFNFLNKVENYSILKIWLKNVKIKKLSKILNKNLLIKAGCILFIQMVYKLNNKLYKEVFTGLCISSNHKIINIISIVQKVLITKLVLVKINLLKKIYIINYSTQFIRKFSIYKKARLYYIYKFKSKKMTRTYKHLLKRFPNYKPIK